LRAAYLSAGGLELVDDVEFVLEFRELPVEPKDMGRPEKIQYSCGNKIEYETIKARSNIKRNVNCCR
jgi:hypothetical protein